MYLYQNVKGPPQKKKKKKLLLKSLIIISLTIEDDLILLKHTFSIDPSPSILGTRLQRVNIGSLSEWITYKTLWVHKDFYAKHNMKGKIYLHVIYI